MVYHLFFKLRKYDILFLYQMYSLLYIWYILCLLYYDILYHFKIIYIYDYACVCVHKLLFKNIKMNTNWIILINIMVI